MGSAAGKQIYIAEYLYITYYFHILGQKLPETKGQFIRCTNIKFYQIPPRGRPQIHELLVNTGALGPVIPISYRGNITGWASMF